MVGGERLAQTLQEFGISLISFLTLKPDTPILNITRFNVGFSRFSCREDERVKLAPQKTVILKLQIAVTVYAFNTTAFNTATLNTATVPIRIRFLKPRA